MTRRKFVGVVGAAAVGGALLGPAAAWAGSRHLQVRRHKVAFAPGRGLRIVHLTDPHVGLATPRKVLAAAAAAAPAAPPARVVMPGPYVNRTLAYRKRLDVFLRALPRPCVAVLGNHDHWTGGARVRPLLEAAGVLVLSNESRRLQLSGGRELTVVGVDDETTGHADVAAALAGVERPEDALVLTHHPNTADAIVAAGGRLVLAGHTHGGQVLVPGVTAPLARLGGIRYLSGWHDVGPGRLYVNTGLGAAVVGWRLGRAAWPEVAVLELNAADGVAPERPVD